MLVNWKYIYKRRDWSIQLILNTLTEQTWENFQEFHSSRGIETPPKSEFTKILLANQQTIPEPEKKAPVKRKRTYIKKEASNDNAKKSKK